MGETHMGKFGATVIKRISTRKRSAAIVRIEPLSSSPVAVPSIPATVKIEHRNDGFTVECTTSEPDETHYHAVIALLRTMIDRHIETARPLEHCIPKRITV
jgi:hypothetical protein